MVLQKRKKIRLEGYDYSSCGAYFVTICVAQRQIMLWENMGSNTYVVADTIRQNPKQPWENEGTNTYVGADTIRQNPKQPWENEEANTNVGADTIRPTLPGLSEYGKIVDTSINAISSHYDNVVVNKYCIMPDHIHLIIFILPDESGMIVSAPTLSTIVGQMKRWVSKQIGFSIDLLRNSLSSYLRGNFSFCKEEGSGHTKHRMYVSL